MSTLPANTEKVSIFNSENNSEYGFTLRKDRLEAFYEYLITHRGVLPPVSPMPGISGSAAYGLDCVFFGPKPPRFPAMDILKFLRDNQIDASISVQEVEAALGQWAGTVTQLLADGTERA